MTSLATWLCHCVSDLEFDRCFEKYLSTPKQIASASLFWRLRFVKLRRLEIKGLRSLTEASLHFDSGVNLLTGPNGAGKTSVLEAAFLLSHGRSFRQGARDALLQRGANSFSVFAEWEHGDGRVVRLGFGRSGNRWDSRVDGEGVSIGKLVSESAVVCFEPGSHALIAGGAEERRRFLDWGVFHVEHSFLLAWRRYQRALKQRNSLLRGDAVADIGLFSPWESEMARAGEEINKHRAGYLDQLLPYVSEYTQLLLPELGAVSLGYRPGWPDNLSLVECLANHRPRDMSRGHSTVGPHRADWSIAFDHAPLREHLSRGQEKLTALACYLAQAKMYSVVRGEWPLVCLDDLASELDHAHQEAVVVALDKQGSQILVTGTDVPMALQHTKKCVFHVEQGAITRLL